MMTRKDFIKIAEITSHYDLDNDMIRELVEWLGSENPNFDFYEFQEVCGRYI